MPKIIGMVINLIFTVPINYLVNKLWAYKKWFSERIIQGNRYLRAQRRCLGGKKKLRKKIFDYNGIRY